LSAIVLLGCLLAWQIGTRAIANRYAESDPGVALRLSADDPDALSTLSSQLLVGKGRPRSINASEAAARRVIEIAPLKSEALRNLGLITDARGREASAAVIMSRAGKRGFRDVPTQAWLLQHAILNLDFGQAFLRVDALLRTQPDLGARLFPLIGALLNEPDAIEPLARRLATNPQWRPASLAYLSSHAPDIGPVVAIDDELRSLGRGPTDNEAASLLVRMINDGHYVAAYRLWLGFLPDRSWANGGEPYDGHFNGLAGSPPFNWQFFQPQGAIVEPTKAQSSQTGALYVEYPVADSVLLAQQLLVLPPGTYRFSGRVRVTQPAAGAALIWRVQCAGAPATVLWESRENGDVATTWISSSVNFTAPADCGAQWLRLEGGAGDGFGILSAWVKDISIQPLSAGTVAAATTPAGAVGAQDQSGQTTP